MAHYLRSLKHQLRFYIFYKLNVLKKGWIMQKY